MSCKSCDELREKLVHMTDSNKRIAMDLDGYEGGAPAKGTRIWRCEKELTKARATIAELRAALDAQRVVIDELRCVLVEARSRYTNRSSDDSTAKRIDALLERTKPQ